MPVKKIYPPVRSIISVIIPSLDGHRGGSVERLVRQLKEQTLRDFDILLVIGERPNGHARNVGVREAKGDIFVFIDDDAILGDTYTIANLIAPFQIDKKIGMTGASTCIPSDSNRFQKFLARQVSSAIYPVVTEITDTLDGATHLCCAFPRRVWEELGGENDLLISGTDVDMRHRVRLAGYRAVLAPNCWAYHPLPPSLMKYLRTVFGYGAGTPVFLKECPELGRFRSQFRAVLNLIVAVMLIIPGSFLEVNLTERRVDMRFNPILALSKPVNWLGYLRGIRRYIRSGAYEAAKQSLANGGSGWGDVCSQGS